ncbi:MAG: enoyl-CoA hydratase/isomerase family protein [Gammaproteobacteria bacterium]
MSDAVTLGKNNRVAEICLDRPLKHNAMTPAMAEQLAAACVEINQDDQIRCAIIFGAGSKAFCAGSDVRALDQYESVFHFRNRIDYSTELRSIRKPVIAALKGWTLGGGLELALSADVRVAARSTLLGAPEVGLGWVGAGGASQLLPRLVGYGRALYLLLDGDPIDAARAAAWGLVETLVSEGEELSEARALAERWARHSTVALQTVKASVRQSMSTPLEAGLRFENETMSLSFALKNDSAGRARFREGDTIDKASDGPGGASEDDGGQKR